MDLLYLEGPLAMDREKVYRHDLLIGQRGPVVIAETLAMAPEAPLVHFADVHIDFY